jgi:predicted outer membrane protein
MAVKLEERLSKKQKEQLERMKSPKNKRFSTKDIEELMGTHRDTYKRVNGAMRRK